LTIDFVDAVFGADKEISLKKAVKCGNCEGSGHEPGSKIETCRTCGGSGRIINVQRTFLGNMQVQSTCQNCRGEGKIYSEQCHRCAGRGTVVEETKLTVKIPAGIDEGESIRLSGQGEAGEKGGPAGDLYLQVRINKDQRFVRDGYDIRSNVFISFKQAVLGDKIGVDTVDGQVSLKIPEGTQSGTIFKLKGKGVPRLRGHGRGDHLVTAAIKTPAKITRRQKDILEELGL
jgi:molecular chaperone DnaJ